MIIPSPSPNENTTYHWSPSALALPILTPRSSSQKASETDPRQLELDRYYISPNDPEFNIDLLLSYQIIAPSPSSQYKWTWGPRAFAYPDLEPRTPLAAILWKRVARGRQTKLLQVQTALDGEEKARKLVELWKKAMKAFSFYYPTGKGCYRRVAAERCAMSLNDV